MKAYLDASVVLRRMLEEPGAIRNWSRWDLLVTSELLRVEAFRAMDRLRLAQRVDASRLAEMAESLRILISRLQEVAMDPAVLARAAEPFPTVIGALDAIHLATALVWVQENREPLVFLTHDLQLAIAARTCGFEVKAAS